MRKIAAVLCAATLALSACGGGQEDDARENIKTGVMENSSQVAGGVELTEDQAQCFADGLVDDVGVDKLQDYGLLDENNELVENAQPDDMSAEDAEATAEVITSCVDVKQMIQDQLGAAGSTELTDEQTACVLDAIDEDDIEAGLADSFQGKEGANPLGDSMGAVMSCVMEGFGEELE